MSYYRAYFFLYVEEFNFIHYRDKQEVTKQTQGSLQRIRNLKKILWLKYKWNLPGFISMPIVLITYLFLCVFVCGVWGEWSGWCIVRLLLGSHFSPNSCPNWMRAPASSSSGQDGIELVPLLILWNFLVSLETSHFLNSLSGRAKWVRRHFPSWLSEVLLLLNCLLPHSFPSACSLAGTFRLILPLRETRLLCSWWMLGLCFFSANEA